MNSESTFLREKILEHLFGLEGGYVDDPDDRGGETKFGISKKAYPKLDIKNLTLRQASAIYLQDYWDACRCDDMDDMMAVLVFDAAVNHGARRAAMFLQRLVNSKMDGVIGNKTLAALRKKLIVYSDHDLMVEFLGYRAEFYHGIVQGDSRQAKFLRGWFNRLFKLQQFILET
jgi:lysozyme family protein